MCRKSLPGKLFIFRAGSAIVAVGVDGNTAARQEFPPYFNVFRVHQANEVFHDDVHAVLVKIAVIAEAEKVQLERFALNHQLVGNI